MSPDAQKDLPEPSTVPYRRGPHWIALFAAVFTLPLLSVGGTVTTYRVGLAVPDWPQTFGINMFLYDFWNAPFGVRVEHTHRLYGAAVGMATLILTAYFLIFEPRRWMKGLGVLSLVAVIVQGVLGGTRVTQVSTFLAAVHGLVGQTFFGLMVVLCVLTGKGWQDDRPPVVDTGRLRFRALGLVGLVVAQIALGSWLRHYGARTALAIHAGLALAIWFEALNFSRRVRGEKASLGVLIPSSLAVFAAATAQILLGLIAMIYLLPFDGTPRPVSFYQAVVRTGHQTNGAVLLAAAIVVALRAFRHLVGPASDRLLDLARRPARQAEPAARTWEAVA
jgi:cytochrome c oxidase assembly protein subunit 15